MNDKKQNGSFSNIKYNQGLLGNRPINLHYVRIDFGIRSYSIFFFILSKFYILVSILHFFFKRPYIFALQLTHPYTEIRIPDLSQNITMEYKLVGSFNFAVQILFSK